MPLPADVGFLTFLEPLEQAAELNAYVLTDRGTFISYLSGEGKKASLTVLIEGEETLRNQYGVIAVSPSKCKHANYGLAKKFIDWLVSGAGQTAIADFRLQGKQLFTPNAE